MNRALILFNSFNEYTCKGIKEIFKKYTIVLNNRGQESDNMQLRNSG